MPALTHTGDPQNSSKLLLSARLNVILNCSKKPLVTPTSHEPLILLQCILHLLYTSVLCLCRQGLAVEPYDVIILWMNKIERYIDELCYTVQWLTYGSMQRLDRILDIPGHSYNVANSNSKIIYSYIGSCSNGRW